MTTSDHSENQPTGLVARIRQLAEAVRQAAIAVKTLAAVLAATLLLAIELFNAYATVCTYNSSIGTYLKVARASGNEELKGWIDAFFARCSALAARPDLAQALADGALPLTRAPSSTGPAATAPPGGAATTLSVPQVPPLVGDIAAPPSRGPASVGVGTAPTRLPADPVVSISGKEGWVAVGYLPDDPIFRREGEPGRLAAVKTGDVLVALTQANLRRGAADWNKPLAVVAAGQRVKVIGEPKVLDAGGSKQTWAHVQVQ